MKILFISSLYPKEIYTQLYEQSNGMLQIQSNLFQWGVVTGMEQCNAEYTIACVPALPAWPRYRNLFTPRGLMKVGGEVRGDILRYCDTPAIKQLSERRVLYRYIRSWCDRYRSEDCICALVYTQQSEKLGAVIDLKKRFPNLIVVPIITDLIDNAMDFKSNHRLLKRVQLWLEKRAQHRLFPQVDKYILLTDQMSDCIPESIGRKMIMEGISCVSDPFTNKIVKNDDVRTLLYTGSLQEFTGVRQLVDAFLKTTDSRFRLIICGKGPCSSYIQEISQKDSRIIYKGRVEHEEALRLQRECTVMINPRRPNGNITKYSFPSKTMEYMTSGTPMIGYHLEGIPKDYYPYMYTPKDLTSQALIECLNHTLSLPLHELQDKADSAYDFILNNKSAKSQVCRMLNFIAEVQ